MEKQLRQVPNVCQSDQRAYLKTGWVCPVASLSWDGTIGSKVQICYQLNFASCQHHPQNKTKITNPQACSSMRGPLPFVHYVKKWGDMPICSVWITRDQRPQHSFDVLRAQNCYKVEQIRAAMCLSLPNWMQLQYDSEISILVASQVTSAYLRLQVISRAAMKEGFVELCEAICEEMAEIEKLSTQAVCNIIRGIYVSAAEQPLLQLSLPTMLRKTVTNRIYKLRHLANNSDRNISCNVNPILLSFRSTIITNLPDLIIIAHVSTSLSSSSHILSHSTNSTRDERRIPNKPRHGHYVVTCQRTRSKP